MISYHSQFILSSTFLFSFEKFFAHAKNPFLRMLSLCWPLCRNWVVIYHALFGLSTQFFRFFSFFSSKNTRHFLICPIFCALFFPFLPKIYYILCSLRSSRRRLARLLLHASPAARCHQAAFTFGRTCDQSGGGLQGSSCSLRRPPVAIRQHLPLGGRVIEQEEACKAPPARCAGRPLPSGNIYLLADV